VIAEHEAILTAIEAHDPPPRWTAMERHLEGFSADIRLLKISIRSSSTRKADQLHAAKTEVAQSEGKNMIE